jgi:glutamyl-tRNA synthetase/nondiscriminating glutamyl-tRNA synthetase
MPLNDYRGEHPPHPNPYSATDIITLLHENHWLAATPTSEHLAWAERAGHLLGHYAEDRAALADLLRPVFHYDAAEILQSPGAQAGISRYAARDVIRHLALLVLEPAPFTSERFKEVATYLKETCGVRSRDLFHPIRLALTGRIGEGELDRVILLLDEAAALPFATTVKSVRTRILEFCSALD